MAELGSAVSADPSTDAHSANSSADQPSRVIAAVSFDEADNVSDTSAATYTEADATSEEVAELLYELANVLIANLPDLIGLLSGSRRGFANAAVTKQNGRLSFSLSQEGSPFSVDLTANWGTSDTSETAYAFGAMGRRWKVSGTRLTGGSFRQISIHGMMTWRVRRGRAGWLVLISWPKRRDQPCFIEGCVLCGQRDVAAWHLHRRI